MSLRSRPLWFEGMFVNPQHFQQYDRWIEWLLEERSRGLKGYAWGLRVLKLDSKALELGKFAVESLKAVMPDGTVLSMPEDMPAPAPRTFSQADQGKTIHIAVPMRPTDGVEYSASGAVPRRLTSQRIDIRDATNPDRPNMPIDVGHPNAVLKLSGEVDDDFTAVPIGRIKTIEANGAITLDQAFIPPTLDVAASPRLIEFLLEVQRLLKSRAEVLVGRVGGSRADSGGSGLIDQVLLGILNRNEVQLDHMARAGGTHPEAMYRFLIGLAGELAAYMSASRRPAVFPPYVHLTPETVFPPIIDDLRTMLSVVTETRAIKIPLRERDYGIWVGPIADRTIFKGYRFVLLATSKQPSEHLRGQLPAQIKIGPVEQIRDLVNLQLPGVPITSLPVAPRDLPFFRDAVYFELNQSAELWQRLPNSAAFAFHVSGDYPGLYMEFWAVRDT